jgi:hypothetical protein
MLDFFLACARKEPHYRIYFLAFTWYCAGKTPLRPDCDAPAGPWFLKNPRAICKYTDFSVSVKSPQ